MFIYALACQASIISAFMSTCFLIGLYAQRDRRLQHKMLYTHIPSRLGRLEEVKETTEFSGITLSPGFCSSANWDAGNYANERMCKCEVFNIQYA